MNLKAGIFGTGSMGAVHGRCLVKTPGVDLVAVAGSSLQRSQDLIAREKWTAAAYSSFGEMLARQPLDCIFFCLPPFAHGGEVEQAAAKGLHVFLEKPIALSSDHARRMVSAIISAGVVSQVGFHMRFLKTVEKFKSLIEAGNAGAPTLFDARYWVNMDGNPWWRDGSKSGGQLHEQVIHLYDLATYLFGEAVSVSGKVKNLARKKEGDYSIEDTSLGMLEFANGALAAITGSNAAIPDHFIADFRAVCQHLVVDYSSTGQAWVTPDRGAFYRAGVPPEFIVEDRNPYEAQTRDFIDAIRQGRSARTPVIDGLKAIELVERIKASADFSNQPAKTS